MKTGRIYSGTAQSRKLGKFRMWLEISSQQQHRAYWQSMRSSYRIMREAGVHRANARWFIYDMLLLGTKAQRCDEYRADR